MQLETEYIIVRPLKLSDARDLQRNINDKAIVRYTVSIPYPYSINNALEYIRKISRKNKKKPGYSFGIALKETGQIIGGIGFHKIDLDNRNAELGYWLGKKYWGYGITTQAVRLMLKFGFEELGLHRICAKVFNENFASRRVLEKSGFMLEGILRHEHYRFRRWHDALTFGILEDEYYKKKSNLPNRPSYVSNFC